MNNLCLKSDTNIQLKAHQFQVVGQNRTNINNKTVYNPSVMN